jgi:hypothetical protein
MMTRVMMAQAHSWRRFKNGLEVSHSLVGAIDTKCARDFGRCPGDVLSLLRDDDRAARTVLFEIEPAVTTLDEGLESN